MSIPRTERQKKNAIATHTEAIEIIDRKLKVTTRRLDKNRLYRSRQAREEAIIALQKKPTHE